MPYQLIYALDLATKTGFAIGAPGAKPRSGVVKLKDPEDEAARAMRNIGCFLRDQFTVETPDLVVYEAAMTSGAMLNHGNASVTADFAWQLVGAVEAICGCYGVRTVPANVQTVRKHFTGRARYDSRKEAKRAVVQRCHLLGLMPRAKNDDNQADALAIWNWAEARYGRRAPEDFTLTSDGAAA